MSTEAIAHAMSPRARRPFEPLSFSRQFLLTSAALLIVAMLVIGAWLGRQIELSAVNRTAAMVAVYTESILATQLGPALQDGSLHDPRAQTHARLDRLFVDSPLQRKVVRFKLWDRNGTILYSSDPAQRGRRFPVEGALAAALGGELQARLSRLEQPDNLAERARWPQLLEVYVPLKLEGSAEVELVAEFYHATDNLLRDIEQARQRSWALLACATLAVYLLLSGLVRRANDTIVEQRRDLQRQLEQLRTALQENERVRAQLRAAGARTTALNEAFLHRIAADLHDGPAQQIAFALMRFDEAPIRHGDPVRSDGIADPHRGRVQSALHAALVELRAIAAGLGLPGVEALSLTDTIRRAVRDVERQTGATAGSDIAGANTVAELEIAADLAGLDIGRDPAGLALKITAYRFIQESLNNSVRHAPGGMRSLTVRRHGDELALVVTDAGPGFDPDRIAGSGRLGLALLRERVHLLGGVFELDSAPDRGTTVRARLPIKHGSSTHAPTDPHPARR